MRLEVSHNPVAGKRARPAGRGNRIFIAEPAMFTSSFFTFVGTPWLWDAFLRSRFVQARFVQGRIGMERAFLVAAIRL
jgi:hypothetical protein